MNKFLFLKARDKPHYERALHRLRERGPRMLPMHPDRITLLSDPENFLFFVAFERTDTGGFHKRYTALGDKRLFAIDGLAYTRDIRFGTHYAADVERAWTHGDDAVQSLHGTWALGQYRQSSGARFLSDFTGMTPLFYWRDARYFAVSPRQQLLAHICGEGEWDLVGLSWLAGQANLMGDRTAFRNVFHLPPQWSLSISATASDLNPRLEPREIWSDKPDPTIRDSELRQAESAFISHFDALSALPIHDCKIDITGGLDSRLVAAGAMSSQLRSRVRALSTHGPENGHEIQVGREVAAKLGVPHEAATPKAPHLAPEEILAKLRASVFRYEAGICPSDGLINPARSSRSVLTGAAGEIYRRHCKPHLQTNIRSTGELLSCFKSYHQKTDPLALERRSFRRHQEQFMQRLALRYAREGADLNDITDIFFMRYRLPLWNGILLNNIYSTLRLYPLVDYRCAKFAFQKGYRFRVSDRLHFELLIRINPELAAMPFLQFVWPEHLQKRAHDYGVTVADQPFKVSGTHHLRQKSPILEAMMGPGWELARQYLLDAPNSRLWDILDRTAVEQRFRIGSGDLKGVVGPKQIFAALGMQCALTGDMKEERQAAPPSSVHFDGDAAAVFGAPECAT